MSNCPQQSRTAHTQTTVRLICVILKTIQVSTIEVSSQQQPLLLDPADSVRASCLYWEELNAINAHTQQSTDKKGMDIACDSHEEVSPKYVNTAARNNASGSRGPAGRGSLKSRDQMF